MRTTKILLIFLIGVIVGVVGHWFMAQPRSDEMVANAHQNVRESASRAGDSLKETFTSENIKTNLSHAGETIREGASRAGDAIADATANARTTAAIKTKMVADSGLSAFKIDVDTVDGVVTLSGTVSSPDDIARAIKLAMEVEGVDRVVSTLLVKPN